jgi:modulator of FtsH protease HflK
MSSSDQDPWKREKSPGTPPNLDDLFKKFYEQTFQSKGGKGSTGKDPGEIAIEPKFFSWILGILVFLWALSGIYIVAPAESAVVLQFGRFFKTVEAGPHWAPRFIQTPNIVDIQKIYNFSTGAEMLTQDENIVNVELSVQYRVSNPQNFLFNVSNPENSLYQATAAALRQVVGHTRLDDILTSGRAVARENIENIINETMTLYHTGIEVTDVNLLPAKPPEQVTEAFDDAIKAREDEQRFINQANAYKQRVVPIAQGRAARILKAAAADKEQYIFNSKAEIAPFLALLPQHKLFPEVMDQRLYFAAMESVFTKSTKILVNSKGSGQMLYLPLDKLFDRKTSELIENQSMSEQRKTGLETDASIEQPKQPQFAQRQNLRELLLKRRNINRESINDR